MVKDFDKHCKNNLVTPRLLHSYDRDPRISEVLTESRCNQILDSSHLLCAYHKCTHGHYWHGVS